MSKLPYQDDRLSFNKYVASVKASEVQGSKPLIEISSDQTALEALEVLDSHHILAAPVKKKESPDGELWVEKYEGLISVLDIVAWVVRNLEEEFKLISDSKLYFEPTDSRNVPVTELLDPDRSPFIPVSVESSLQDCMSLLATKKCYRLFVRISLQTCSYCRSSTMITLTRWVLSPSPT